MRTTVQLMDAVKARHEMPSDYRLAKVLGVSFSRVSNWRRGHHGFSDEVAIKVAELLEEPPELVLLEVLAERAKRTEVRAVLEAAARRLAAAVVVLGLAGAGGFGGGAAQASTGSATYLATHYAHLRRRSRGRGEGTSEPARAAA